MSNIYDIFSGEMVGEYETGLQDLAQDPLVPLIAELFLDYEDAKKTRMLEYNKYSVPHNQRHIFDYELAQKFAVHVLEVIDGQ